MARRRSVVTVPYPVTFEEDTRPEGSLRFADPSKAEFPRHIHTFNEPHSNAMGESHGVRSMTGMLVPWDDRHVNDPWAVMNRKRGVVDPAGEEN